MAAATPVDPNNANAVYEAMIAAAQGRPLGNGSMFLMPAYDRMPGAGLPGGSFPYGNLADQFIDANIMQNAGAGPFQNNQAGRYAFGGPQFGGLNPKAAAGQGLLGFGGGGQFGGGAQYNPFAGRGNNWTPPGGPPGAAPPGGPPPGSPPPGGIPPPAYLPPRQGPGAGIPPPISQLPRPQGPVNGGIPPTPGGGGRPQGGGGLLGQVAGPIAPQAGNPPANWQTPPNTPLSLAQMAMVADPSKGKELFVALGGNPANWGGSDQSDPAYAALHQMMNAYGPSGQYYRPWLSALASQGLQEPPQSAWSSFEQQGLGSGSSGKWVWAPGKGWDSYNKSVY